MERFDCSLKWHNGLFYWAPMPRIWCTNLFCRWWEVKLQPEDCSVLSTSISILEPALHFNQEGSTFHPRRLLRLSFQRQRQKLYVRKKKKIKACRALNRTWEIVLCCPTFCQFKILIMEILDMYFSLKNVCWDIEIFDFLKTRLVV